MKKIFLLPLLILFFCATAMAQQHQEPDLSYWHNLDPNEEIITPWTEFIYGTPPAFSNKHLRGDDIPTAGIIKPIADAVEADRTKIEMLCNVMGNLIDRIEQLEDENASLGAEIEQLKRQIEANGRTARK
jgi:hypothetical protein